MRIRDYQTEDEAALVELWQACGLTRPWNDPQMDIAMAISTPGSRILVGELSSTIVASAMVGFDGHRGWIYYMAVAPDRRGQGLGRMMFGAAKSWLKDCGALKLQLMVRADNEKAIGFYRALGLEPQAVTTLGVWLKD
jgi:ribosomal protein S18 acetylase RimI-like enzyme